MSPRQQQRVVITADDLGLSAENNAGILAAYQRGTLTTACLMVGGTAADEGIEIARANPNLAVGLHVSLADTKPILPPEQVPLLVQSDGFFPPDESLCKPALRSREGRRQIYNEIAAQFRAYHHTGLAWDHVNTHRHIHRNPLLAFMVFNEAKQWPVSTTRVPWDPPADPLRRLRTVFLKRLASYYGLLTPEQSIGRKWSPTELINLLANLPKGTTEIYFHPVSSKTHMFAADLPTLLDDRVAATLAQLDVRTGLADALRG